jgi:hypothetical protein
MAPNSRCISTTFLGSLFIPFKVNNVCAVLLSTDTCNSEELLLRIQIYMLPMEMMFIHGGCGLRSGTFIHRPIVDNRIGNTPSPNMNAEIEKMITSGKSSAEPI